jgi:hypothetical protein
LCIVSVYGAIIFHHNISCSLKCTLWYRSIIPQILFRICSTSIMVRASAQSSIRALPSAHPLDIRTHTMFTSTIFLHSRNVSTVCGLRPKCPMPSPISTCTQCHSYLCLKRFPLAPTALAWTATSDYPPPSQVTSIKAVSVVK